MLCCLAKVRKCRSKKKFIAILKNPTDKKAKHKGSDLLLKDLQTDKTLNIGNVSSYAFNKEGTLFSYLVDADGDNGNGIYVIDLNNLRTWPLHTGALTYSQMTWNKMGNQIAVMFGSKGDDKKRIGSNESILTRIKTTRKTFRKTKNFSY